MMKLENLYPERVFYYFYKRIFAAGASYRPIKRFCARQEFGCFSVRRIRGRYSKNAQGN